MSLIMRTLFAGFALLPTALAATSMLLASHFSGAIFSLALNTQGSNGTLAITSAAGGCSSTPTWPRYYADTKKLYCWDESWQGYSMAEYNVSTDGTLTVNGQATPPGNDVHGLLTPSTLTTYALPLKAGPDRPFTTPLQMETFYMAGPGPNERQHNGPHRTKLSLIPLGNSSSQLNACPDAQTAPGDGPRHGEFWSPKGNTTSPDGLKLYTVNELGNSASSWSVTYGAGCASLNKTQTISTFAAGKVPAATMQLPLAANRNDKLFENETDSLATYSIDPTTGTVTWVEATSAHAFYPRSSSVNKAGAMVAVGGQTSSSVAIVARDTITGNLGSLIASLQIGAQGTYTNEDGLSSVVWVEKVSIVRQV
ncbi:uncharacterized protein PAC_07373 [Phialocephala subalpina]|uniref:Uncharacterized protein n=1 Tax=Phialocephala subalpina TaxID=576137 RepID=A0A1L7WXI7_9HELO|nr:uncharacterized protein PAC_07373 [Phialocephala subalpina]